MEAGNLLVTGHHISLLNSQPDPQNLLTFVYDFGLEFARERNLCDLDNSSETKATIHGRLWHPDVEILQYSSAALVIVMQLLRFPRKFCLLHTLQCFSPKSLITLITENFSDSLSFSDLFYPSFSLIHPNLNAYIKHLFPIIVVVVLFS